MQQEQQRYRSMSGDEPRARGRFADLYTLRALEKWFFTLIALLSSVMQHHGQSMESRPLIAASDATTTVACTAGASSEVWLEGETERGRRACRQGSAHPDPQLATRLSSRRTHCWPYGMYESMYL